MVFKICFILSFVVAILLKIYLDKNISGYDCKKNKKYQYNVKIILKNCEPLALTLYLNGYYSSISEIMRDANILKGNYLSYKEGNVATMVNLHDVAYMTIERIVNVESEKNETVDSN